MHQKVIYKVCSVAMAFLVFMSTLSFTMEKHFCGDTLIDVAIFSRPDSCGMEMDTMNIATSDQKSCCKEKVEIVKGQDQLKKTSFEDFPHFLQFFLKSLSFIYNDVIEDLSKHTPPYQNYSPPYLVTDIHILDQVYLI